MQPKRPHGGAGGKRILNMSSSCQHGHRRRCICLGTTCYATNDTLSHLYVLCLTREFQLGARHDRGYNSHVGWTDVRRRARPAFGPSPVRRNLRLSSVGPAALLSAFLFRPTGPLSFSLSLFLHFPTVSQVIYHPCHTKYSHLLYCLRSLTLCSCVLSTKVVPVTRIKIHSNPHSYERGDEDRNASPCSWAPSSALSACSPRQTVRSPSRLRDMS